MLFNILILGSLVDESGYVFQRSYKDLFIIETTNPQENVKELFLNYESFKSKEVTPSSCFLKKLDS